ncbi:MAG: response regulator transcription factor [Chitinophagaceae bacterium]|nr:response regulator transcription factor [Chitinophagaceae bacterium]
MYNLRCIIIDDEPLAQNIIENYLSNFSFVELLGKFNNPIAAFEIIKKEKIDLIFLDIAMPYISGIDFIKTLQYPPKIIITTAYKEYALEGYDLNVIDYLLKPVSLERFIKAMNKVVPTDIRSLNVEQKEEPGNPQSFIYVKSNGKNVKVLLDSILFVESMKDYIKIYTDTSLIITQISISSIEKRLPNSFLRVHRSFIISLKRIEAFTNDVVEIKKHQVPIGRYYKDQLMHLLKDNL